MNKFTDMAPEEFARHKGKVFQPKADEPYNRFDTGVSLGDLPPAVDCGAANPGGPAGSRRTPSHSAEDPLVPLHIGKVPQEMRPR